MPLPLLKAARPHQWVKNLFVAAPLVFAQRMYDPDAVVRTLLAVLCFCMLSSAVYLLNDVMDVDKDRAHPLKRFRPIASGALPLPAAKLAAAVAAGGSLIIGAWLSWRFAAIGAGYLLLNLAYSFGLKRVPFVDVGCISLGFLLRVLGGAFAIPVEPSAWLLACTLLLAALLGFGKRAHELRVAGERGGVQRDVLEAYDPQVLHGLLVILAGLTVVTYAAYTQSPHALTYFGTRSLVVTVPFVAFGIYRFLRITGRKADAESPTESMLKDKLFLLNLVLYAMAIVFIIYYGERRRSRPPLHAEAVAGGAGEGGAGLAHGAQDGGNDAASGERAQLAAAGLGPDLEALVPGDALVLALAGRALGQRAGALAHRLLRVAMGQQVAAERRGPSIGRRRWAAGGIGAGRVAARNLDPGAADLVEQVAGAVLGFARAPGDRTAVTVDPAEPVAVAAAAIFQLGQAHRPAPASVRVDLAGLVVVPRGGHDGGATIARAGVQAFLAAGAAALAHGITRALGAAGNRTLQRLTHQAAGVGRGAIAGFPLVAAGVLAAEAVGAEEVRRRTAHERPFLDLRVVATAHGRRAQHHDGGEQQDPGHLVMQGHAQNPTCAPAPQVPAPTSGKIDGELAAALALASGAGERSRR